MFNSLAFFHFAALEHSPKGTAGEQPLDHCSGNVFPIFSLGDAQSVIGAVEGRIGGSLSEAKTYGKVPLTLSHGSLLDTACRFMCMLWNRYQPSIYNIYKVFSIMSRHMLSTWLCGGTVYRGLRGFAWPLVVVVSCYCLTQTHDLRDRWKHGTCNPIIPISPQTSINAACIICILCGHCRTAWNAAIRLSHFDSQMGVGDFWSKPV